MRAIIAEAPEELMVLLLGGAAVHRQQSYFWVAQRFPACDNCPIFQSGFSR